MAILINGRTYTADEINRLSDAEICIVGGDAFLRRQGINPERELDRADRYLGKDRQAPGDQTEGEADT